ncbi:arginine--tRNA ligase [Candidatus Poribacteria bacterium]|nr:arginine--tRNA ligase [Candidatus Poribacteria bacterium]
MTGKVRERIARAIEQAIDKAISQGVIPEVQIPKVKLERPRDERFGDLACTVALELASRIKTQPRKVAEEIVSRMDSADGLIESVEIAGPGFINIKLSKGWLENLLRQITSQKEDFGRCDLGKGKKVQVEFVSTNPTGPLNVVNGRAASVGDSLVNILQAVGYDVTREFYINDAGGQAYRLAKSIEARYQQLIGNDVPFPEDGYKGEYVTELAKSLIQERGDDLARMDERERLELFREIGCARMVEWQKRDLERFRVFFDVWTSEKAIRDSGKPEMILERLREKGYLYERDGAVWFRSTDFGDDKDRVLIKSDGEYTYVVPDIAYHYDKFERGFDRVIDIWGPDHYGYIVRLKAAIQAMGIDPERLQIMIVQMVRLVRGGQSVKMSKRKGEFITLADLLDELAETVDERFAVDVARFFFVMRSHSTHLDFDMDLAISQANDNPVFYIQYAHARICSIFRQAAERGIERWPIERVDLSLLGNDEEVSLMRSLAQYPEVILGAAQSLEPHRIPYYLLDLATRFHAFYDRHRVLDRENMPLTQARMILADAVGQVIRNGLSLLGIRAPERM